MDVVEAGKGAAVRVASVMGVGGRGGGVVVQLESVGAVGGSEVGPSEIVACPSA